jgi:PAS domain S-box-containing protein
MSEETAGLPPQAQLGHIVEIHWSELLPEWRKNLAGMSQRPAEAAFARLSSEIDSGTDLLSMLRRGAEVFSDEQLNVLVEKVRRPDFSVADLYSEFESLRQAFHDILPRSGKLPPAEASALLRSIHSLMAHAFATVLQRSTTLYEHVVEGGPQAICEIGPGGEITYANPAMHNLFRMGTRQDKRLAAYFNAPDAGLITSALKEAEKGRSAVRELELPSYGGNLRRVWLHIAPAGAEGMTPGFCAAATDVSKIVSREEKFLDLLELPAIKLNQRSQITYANPATMTLLGSDENILGRSVFDLFPNKRKLTKQFDKRREGKGDVYNTEFVRPSDGKRIPVCIAGTPILDDAGNYVGTLGIVRSLERERAAEAIHALIDKEREETPLLTGVAKQVQRLIPCDYFSVSQYSQASDHVCTWFACTGSEEVVHRRRWWSVSKEQKRDSRQPMIVPDLNEYVRTTRPDLIDDPDVKHLMDIGFRSMLRIPVAQEDRVIAGVVLLSKQENRYSQSDLDLLLSLPVEQAVQMAFYYKSRRDFQFRYDLFKAMTRCQTITEVAERLAEALAGHYGWDHVHVMRVSRADNVLRILAESSATGGQWLGAEKREQPLDAGVAGHVCRTKERVNIPDFAAPELPESFVPAWPDSRSELCLPIIWDDDVQWILTAGDDRVDAYSKDEEEDVAAMLNEAALVLSRISRQYLIESAFRSSSDAVFVTDTQSKILFANPSAATLLGYRDPAELNGPFERIFPDGHVARRVFETTGSAAVEVELLRRDGSKVAVLVSGSELPEELFRKAFIAKDLTAARRLEKLETLRKLFEEIAVQTHTPLAMVKTWLTRAGSDQASADLCTKILGQLKKLEITYDRLALSSDCARVFNATSKQPLDLGVELKRTIEEFPDSERALIDFRDPGELPWITGDPAQISYMFGTVLSYLARLCGGQGNCVCVRIEPGDGRVKVSFAAAAVPAPDESHSALARAKFELALGEPTIVAFAGNNSATYQRTTDAETTRIDLEFGRNGV